MVITEQFFGVILKLLPVECFYVDLLCPLISGRCNGRASLLAEVSHDEAKMRDLC